MASISIEEQQGGKLIQRSTRDVDSINRASNQFFSLLYKICHEVDLAFKVLTVPSNSHKRMRKDVTSEKVMPGIASIAITRQIDDTAKRARSIIQRTNILLKSIIGAWFRNSVKRAKKLKSSLWTEAIL
jgi:hypothetical protein